MLKRINHIERRRQAQKYDWRGGQAIKDEQSLVNLYGSKDKREVLFFLGGS